MHGHGSRAPFQHCLHTDTGVPSGNKQRSVRLFMFDLITRADVTGRDGTLEQNDALNQAARGSSLFFAGFQIVGGKLPLLEAFAKHITKFFERGRLTCWHVVFEALSHMR